MEKTVRPYGLWPSPVTPALLGGRLRLDNPQFDSDGAAWSGWKAARTAACWWPGPQARRPWT